VQRQKSTAEMMDAPPRTPLRFPLDADPILALLLTIAVREHQACYFYAYAEGEKQRPDPDVFGCEKHQDAS
jgi:hypothetical protein